MDEIPLACDSLANINVDKIGTKAASVLTTGHERASFARFEEDEIVFPDQMTEKKEVNLTIWLAWTI
ncbi:hypothetical protein NPIL_459131 [Nephila pilipes]|uniref:Uncharacterized protein n=1 Tax=Nephila pilipes TaxID=299642 RepID=A0A8X6PQ20_NEPPI|nr:hypothetical protein NPIL_459131 [Nephila pilipes]